MLSDILGHPVEVRESTYDRGRSVAVYCGEERYLAGEVVLSSRGRIRVCVWSCRPGPNVGGMPTLLPDETLLTAAIEVGVEMIASAWAREVLPEPEYAYWREHYKDCDGKEIVHDPEEKTEHHAEGVTWEVARRRVVQTVPAAGFGHHSSRDVLRRAFLKRGP